MLRYPRVGDEVRTTKPTTTSLWGSAVRPGAHCVVLSVGFIHSTVKLDTHGGFAITTIPTSSLRVIRRSVGEERFTHSRQLVHLARLGVALVMVTPFVIFTVKYVIATGGTDGLLETMVAGLINSVFDFLNLMLVEPIGTGIYLLAGWLLWRFAFPR